MDKTRIKKIATWVVVPLMAAIFVLDIVTVALGNAYCKPWTPQKETFTYEYGNDRIHFLNTANSDAILIESNGRFALIDAGEGNNNPRRKTAYKGYEDEVRAYIKQVAADGSGTARLDFILGTHCHYDHIGAFHAIITDPDIKIDKAYFKQLDETYSQIRSDLEVLGVPGISDLPREEFAFGDFTIKFFNTVTPPEMDGEGENAASVGVKVTKGERTAFLAADITKSTGLEQLLGGQIGHVDLLKVGHHGYLGSSSAKFLKQLSPEVAIVTNQLGKVYPNVKWNLTMIAKVPFFATYDHNGIIASFTDDGRIVLTDRIHDY